MSRRVEVDRRVFLSPSFVDGVFEAARPDRARPTPGPVVFTAFCAKALARKNTGIEGGHSARIRAAIR